MEVSIDTDKITLIADAIRIKTETNELMTLDEMPTKILSDSGQGGGSNMNFLVQGTASPANFTCTATQLKSSAFSGSILPSNTTWTFPNLLILPNDDEHVMRYVFQNCKMENAASGTRILNLPALSANNYDGYLASNSDFTTINIPNISRVQGYDFNACHYLRKVYANNCTNIRPHAFENAGDSTDGFDLICNITKFYPNSFKGAKINSLVILDSSPTIYTDASSIDRTSWLYTEANKGFIYLNDSIVNVYQAATNEWSLLKIKPLSEYAGSLTLS